MINQPKAKQGTPEKGVKTVAVKKPILMSLTADRARGKVGQKKPRIQNDG